MDLQKVRNQIDEIYGRISELFTKRMNICRDVAEYKRVNNLPVMQGGRERQVLERIRKNSPDDIKDGAEMLFQNIMDISKCIKNMKLKRDLHLNSPKDFIPGNDSEMLFYLDFNVTVSDQKVVSLLHDLENKMSFFRFLGCFKEIF